VSVGIEKIKTVALRAIVFPGPRAGGEKLLHQAGEIRLGNVEDHMRIVGMRFAARQRIERQRDPYEPVSR
jgi:hypothetical protein